MSPERSENAVLGVLVTPADVREIRVRLKARRSRMTEGEFRAALSRLRAQGLVQRWVSPGPPRRNTRCYELTWRGALAAMAQRPARRPSRKSSAVSPAELRRMAERIRRCAALSQTVARLRDATSATGRR